MNFLKSFCDCLGKSSAVVVQIETGNNAQYVQTPSIAQDVSNIINASVDTVQTVEGFKKNPLNELNTLAQH